MPFIPISAQLREQIKLGLLRETCRQKILTEEQFLQLAQRQREQWAFGTPGERVGPLSRSAGRTN